MLRLYYAKFPHSSLPVHIVLEELGEIYDSVLVDLEAEPTEEFLALNPVGGVPILDLDDGQVLTEIAAILQYLADHNPKFHLAPKAGGMELHRLHEWLSFIGTELHKGFWPMGFVRQLTRFPEASEELFRLVRENLENKLDITSKKLGQNEHALESGYSIADPYLFTPLHWALQTGISLARWPSLIKYLDRIEKRPATQRAVQKARG